LRNDRLDGSSDESWRTPAERDEDRLLYASAFRRLTGVTQVVPARESALFHNRLTHSLKVGQVGKRAAAHLLFRTDPKHIDASEGLDPIVLNAAGLAHDLGHPPFGHIAETELQHILGKSIKGSNEGAEKILPDGFEGNAQTFRIVAKLATRKLPQPEGDAKRYRGLGFTRATLAAVLKYPWLKDHRVDKSASKYFSTKWGAYNSESEELEWACQLVKAGHLRSLEAELMDWADDVTYAVHDIEDFYRAGIIPLHEIRYGVEGSGNTSVFEQFWSYATFKIANKGEIDFDFSTAKDALQEIAGFFPSNAYRDSDYDRLILHDFASKLVDRFERGLSINRRGLLEIDPMTKMLIEVLKQLTWHFVIDRPSLASLQRGQVRVIKDLFIWLNSWVRDSYDMRPHEVSMQVKLRKERLPTRLKACIDLCFLDRGSREAYPSDEQKYARGVVDFMATLSEIQAYELHHRLGGSHEQPALGAWVNR
jgi:dGTPase